MMLISVGGIISSECKVFLLCSNLKLLSVRVRVIVVVRNNSFIVCISLLWFNFKVCRYIMFGIE